MIQERRGHRKAGQLIRITDETKAHMRYVMGALKMRQGELAERLGLTPGTLSRILGRYQKSISRDLFQIYYPRLTVLVERADKGVGEIAVVRDPAVKALNPISTPEAKEFALGPYRAKVAERKNTWDARRDNHRAAMKAYWANKRAKEAERRFNVVHDAKVSELARAITPKPMTKHPGFFKRLINAICTGFHVG